MLNNTQLIIMKKTLTIPLLLLTLAPLVLTLTTNNTIEVIVTEESLNNVQTKGITTAPRQALEQIKRNDNITIKHEYTTFNGMIIETTEEELQKLEENPLIHIEEQRVFYTALDVSVPQIGGDTVQNYTLDNNYLNGTGQTVCIIDTGVNYSHNAFGGCYGNNNASSNCTIIGGYDFVNDDTDPMDDNGHGTHVAGIVASQDTTYKGVAPGTKIIAIKALDNGGSGYTSDIVAGIDWCVNNATTFNISVISMSLSDCTNWTTTCDTDSSYNTTWVPAVDAAAAANITILSAAGNGPYGGCVGQPITPTGGPGGPACLSNVTAIGGVNDSDIPYPNWQRGNLFELLAPGYLIRSTIYTGGFGLNSGTSMATPHVAGAAAIIHQVYQSQEGTSISRTDLETLFNNTGLIINDTAGTNNNYTRININEAVLSIDSTPPTITLTNPSNASGTVNPNQTLTCNLTDWQLANNTLYVWNETGTIIQNQTEETTGTTNSTSVNLNNVNLGTYYWNCEGTDNNNNQQFYTTNNTLIVAEVLSDLNSPNNNFQTAQTNNNFTCSHNTSSSTTLTNTTFYLWNATNNLIYNETTTIGGTTNSTTFTYNFTTTGNYTWNCKTENNNTTTTLATNNYTIRFDNSAPIISSISASEAETSITISWTTNENSNESITGELTGSDSSFSTSHSIAINGLADATTYSYYITACDNLANCRTTSQQTAKTTPSGGSSGGGGGGGRSSSTQNTTTLNTSNEKTNKTPTKTSMTTNEQKEEKTFFTMNDEEQKENIQTQLLNILNTTKGKTLLTLLIILLLLIKYHILSEYQHKKKHKSLKQRKHHTHKKKTHKKHNEKNKKKNKTKTKTKRKT
jgi:subtilisin family serine protease